MLIVDARLCDATGERRGDLRIEADRIAQVGEALSPAPGEPVVEASGCLLLPGAVDLNFHLSDPGRGRLESMESSAQLALKGGITTLLAAPDTTPAIDNETVVEYLLGKADATRGARILISGEIAKADQLNNLALLFKAGVVALQGKSTLDGNLLRRAFEYGLMADRPVLIAAQEAAIAGSGVMHEGEVSARLGLPAIGDFAESSEAARVGEIAAALKSRLLIQSVSAARTVAAIESLKTRSGFVSAEVLLTHLLLDEHACEGFNTAARLDPPLRAATDRQALIDAVASGTIDAIASGHQPQDPASKDRPFELAAPGARMADLFLPLAYHYLIETGNLDLPTLVRAISANPAALLGLNAGALAVGKRADLVLFDPEATTAVHTQSAHAPSLWEGQQLKGAVRSAWVGGERRL